MNDNDLGIPRRGGLLSEQYLHVYRKKDRFENTQSLDQSPELSLKRTRGTDICSKNPQGVHFFTCKKEETT